MWTRVWTTTSLRRRSPTATPTALQVRNRDESHDSDGKSDARLRGCLEWAWGDGYGEEGDITGIMGEAWN